MKTRSASPVSVLIRRRFAAGLMMVALLALSLIPAGFMPSVTPDGKVAIVICSGVDSKTILVDADQAPPGAAHEQGDQSCPFFLAQGNITIPSSLTILPAGVDVVPSLQPKPDAVISLVLHAVPPARGPPAVTTL